MSSERLREGTWFECPVPLKPDAIVLGHGSGGRLSARLIGETIVPALRNDTGLAATLVEIATRQQLGIEVDERSVPVREGVRGACEILGLDPLLIANEGKVVIFVPEEGAGRAFDAMRAHPLGRDAARIGVVTTGHPGQVVLRTPIGGRRVLDLPFTEPLPRIC